MADNDLTVCRTMGFADLTSVGTALWNIVYQLWENGIATINTEDNGLGYFGRVIAAAKVAGVKLVVPLYIKSLDSNHLMASGSEGFMNTDKSVYLYSGPSGVDFDANLAIDSIDYGAYHAYPDSWGVDTSEAKSWGVKWIDDHTASGAKAGKPVVLEEYGVKSHNASVYQTWRDAVYAEESNMQYWEFRLEYLKPYKGEYIIYDTDDIFNSTIVSAAIKFKTRSSTP
ncbi:hypothetical protein BBJ29_009360 [Phytophthora kernoviae]|uniref:mannan endo-1,4-beta-mannosidase n=1 Tax=Phytophthora kernoviae TaxID=325452 RepID=A0A3F2RB10_9STRA|nr:hypothetical protein BBP00_00009976 [Phytophthora kernoviae]RLN70075.1 hypothetical protein BBJ29_009360 [Phytophthora kernoviae]